MTERRKIPPVEAWKAIDAMVSQGELDRIKGLSDKEVEDELKEAGFDLDAVRTIGQDAIEKAAREAGIDVGGVTRAAPALGKTAGGEAHGAKVTPFPSARRRTRWDAFLAAAAIAAALIAVFAMAGPAIVAWFRGERIGPDRDTVPRRELPPELRAAQLRDEGFKACAAMQWVSCVAKLDEAKQLDPAGDSDPRVQEWRSAAQPVEPWDGSPMGPDSKKWPGRGEK